MQPQALCAAQKFQLFEMLYMRSAAKRQTDAVERRHKARLRPGTKAVLMLLADCRSALHWSNARIAEHIGYSLRTVARAMVELREAGILTSIRKRRETSQRFLDVSKADQLMRLVRERVKRNCAIALGFVRRGQEVPTEALSDLFYKDLEEKVVTAGPKFVVHAVDSGDAQRLEEALARLEAGVRSRN